MTNHLRESCRLEMHHIAAWHHAMLPRDLFGFGFLEDIVNGIIRHMLPAMLSVITLKRRNARTGAHTEIIRGYMGGHCDRRG